jgi:ATP-dependent Clp protease adaptor protein ClpS
MKQGLLEPIGVETNLGGRWMVVIYNDETITVEEVLSILMVATGCSSDEAYVEIWEAETYGKASVHFASREECLRVSSLIEQIGVRTDVAPEWD